MSSLFFVTVTTSLYLYLPPQKKKNNQNTHVASQLYNQTTVWKADIIALKIVDGTEFYQAMYCLFLYFLRF